MQEGVCWGDMVGTHFWLSPSRSSGLQEEQSEILEYSVLLPSVLFQKAKGRRQDARVRPAPVGDSWTLLCTTRISGSLSCGAREVSSPCAWRGGPILLFSLTSLH